MITIKPFKGFCPRVDIAANLVCKPYDVLDSAEAKKEAEGNEFSFLHITKSEIDFEDGVNIYEEKIYQKAKSNFETFIEKGYLVQDNAPSFYVYVLTMNGRSQTGLVAASSIEDYLNKKIKIHEYTRSEKEEDRIKHIDTLSAQAEPVFFTYRDVSELNTLISEFKKTEKMAYDITTEDAIRHQFWKISDAGLVQKITTIFSEKVPCTYIADGHHRTASTVKVGLKRKAENPNHIGTENYNFFLSVLFPMSELYIMDYNRVVKDLNGLSAAEFLQKLQTHFVVTPIGDILKRPTEKFSFGMYLNESAYMLTFKDISTLSNNPTAILDVSVLSNYILHPILGIIDQRTDKRIDFVGGIRGMRALQQRVQSGETAVAFSIFPTSMNELLSVADAGLVMPPKSTWFEPKLRSGFVVYAF